jgi:hypothetical protein
MQLQFTSLPTIHRKYPHHDTVPNSEIVATQRILPFPLAELNDGCLDTLPRTWNSNRKHLADHLYEERAGVTWNDRRPSVPPLLLGQQKGAPTSAGVN